MKPHTKMEVSIIFFKLSCSQHRWTEGISNSLCMSSDCFCLSSDACFFLFWSLLRMYESSCTRETLHRTPHIHRLNAGPHHCSRCIMDLYFYPVGHKGFELYTCACWTRLTDCALFWPEQTVHRFSLFCQHFLDKLIFKIIIIFFSVWQRSRHEARMETMFLFFNLFLFTPHFGLLTAVVYYLFIYFWRML